MYKYKRVNGKLLHRILMEEKLGRKLQKHEHVHHIDGNQENNDIDNLQLVTSSEHSAIHGAQHKARTFNFKCANCGKEGQKLFRQVTAKLKHGQKDFYCNRSCAAKHFGRGRPKIKLISKHGGLHASC